MICRRCRWFTANIGIRSVHHLSSRIPCYRLGEALRDRPELRGASRASPSRRASGACVSLCGTRTSAGWWGSVRPERRWRYDRFALRHRRRSGAAGSTARQSTRARPTRAWNTAHEAPAMPSNKSSASLMRL